VSARAVAAVAAAGARPVRSPWSTLVINLTGCLLIGALRVAAGRPGVAAVYALATLAGALLAVLLGTAAVRR
jgi:fluoride ion exporter CrcB/FEX